VSSWYLPAKAAVDFVAAIVLLVLASPLLLVAGLLVKLTSRGPVLYAQTRLGRGGRPYKIYKLRTMTHNCEARAGVQWARVGDPRVTPVGRLLRATKLDELPQLWNVLKGDMSLLGPRPERPEIVAALERALPHYRERLLVRPGLSGLAQVQLPPDTDLGSVRRKLDYDRYYVRHLGPWLDLRVALATALYLLRVPFGVARVLLRVPGARAVEGPSAGGAPHGAGGEVRRAEVAGAAGDGKNAESSHPIDLSKVGDKELEILAVVCGYHPAANELASRRSRQSLQPV
jgi:lipopolysaccharide/colanic/teichoic acid biosynthesis glycosyltransferase